MSEDPDDERVDDPPLDDPGVGHDVGSDDGGQSGDGSVDPGGDHPDADGERPDRSAPLGDLAEEVAERRQREGDEFDDLFSDESVDEVDRETLWQQVTDDGRTGEETAQSGREHRIVRKSSYCQGCPYFTEPPAIACSHEGTDILEVVDTDQFLVADCPVVREDEELGDIENVTRPEAYEGRLNALPSADRSD